MRHAHRKPSLAQELFQWLAFLFIAGLVIFGAALDDIQF